MATTSPDTPHLKAAHYLKLLHASNGSDMFFSVGTPVHLKVEGQTTPVDQHTLQSGDVRRLAYQLMTPLQIDEFERKLEMNLALSLGSRARFRLNIYFQRGEVSMVARLIKNQIPSIAALGLPRELEDLATLSRGLVLVVGAAGVGKSTSLAAMLDHRNSLMNGHILCIEDPIEFLHQHKRSIIEQREIGLDTHSFANALRNVMREAPDVIMLGEIRDQDSMRHVLHYAETGHLCLATLHATSTSHALERMVHFFPEESRSSILADLARNLEAIIGQRLISGLANRRIVAVELMRATPHIRDLIQRNQLDGIRSAIAHNPEQGQLTFDQHLYQLYHEGKIGLEQALDNADSRTDLRLKLKLEHAANISNREMKMLRQDLL